MIQLMYVDDHRMWVEAFSHTIATHRQSRGRFAPVIPCYNAEEAINRLALPDPNPDLVIVDFNLVGSERNGIQLVEYLVETHPDLKTVVISGYNTLVIGAMALKAGARGYISKEADWSSMFHDLESVINGSMLFPYEVTMASQTNYKPIEERLIELVAQHLSWEEIGERLHRSAKSSYHLASRLQRQLELDSMQAFREYCRNYTAYTAVLT